MLKQIGKYLSLNNLGKKHSPLMKFGQKTFTWELVPGPFVFAKS